MVVRSPKNSTSTPPPPMSRSHRRQTSSPARRRPQEGAAGFVAQRKDGHAHGLALRHEPLVHGGRSEWFGHARHGVALQGEPHRPIPSCRRAGAPGSRLGRPPTPPRDAPTRSRPRSGTRRPRRSRRAGERPPASSGVIQIVRPAWSCAPPPRSPRGRGRAARGARTWPSTARPGAERPSHDRGRRGGDHLGQLLHGQAHGPVHGVRHPGADVGALGGRGAGRAGRAGRSPPPRRRAEKVSRVHRTQATPGEPQSRSGPGPRVRSGWRRSSEAARLRSARAVAPRAEPRVVLARCAPTDSTARRRGAPATGSTARRRDGVPRPRPDHVAVGAGFAPCPPARVHAASRHRPGARRVASLPASASASRGRAVTSGGGPSAVRHTRTKRPSAVAHSEPEEDPQGGDEGGRRDGAGDEAEAEQDDPLGPLHDPALGREAERLGLGPLVGDERRRPARPWAAATGGRGGCWPGTRPRRRAGRRRRPGRTPSRRRRPADRRRARRLGHRAVEGVGQAGEEEQQEADAQLAGADGHGRARPP